MLFDLIATNLFSLCAAYGTSVVALKGDQKRLSLGGYFIAGMITGAAIAFVEGPIDFFKSQVFPFVLLHMRSISPPSLVSVRALTVTEGASANHSAATWHQDESPSV